MFDTYIRGINFEIPSNEVLSTNDLISFIKKERSIDSFDHLADNHVLTDSPICADYMEQIDALQNYLEIYSDFIDDDLADYEIIELPDDDNELGLQAPGVNALPFDGDLEENVNVEEELHIGRGMGCELYDYYVVFWGEPLGRNNFNDGEIVTVEEIVAIYDKTGQRILF